VLETQILASFASVACGKLMRKSLKVSKSSFDSILSDLLKAKSALRKKIKVGKKRLARIIPAE
jgi:hypothetical protein